MRFKSYFKKKEVFIIGCGRSGTTYISHVFKQLGLDVGHENLGKNGMASWMGTVHDIKELHKGYKLILHQVRDPMNVISSTMTFNENSWKFIYKHIPQMSQYDNKIIQCAKYWYHWNLLAERKTNLRYKVENINEVLPFICYLLKIEPANLKPTIVNNINTRSCNYNKVTWEDIKVLNSEYYEKCKQLSERYGY